MHDEFFPLPLTPFELYYWYDDRPDYPTTYPSELTFRGALRRSVFEEALDIALCRHPMLCALVDPDAGKVPVWISAGNLLPQLDWDDYSTAIDYAPNRFIDLTSSVGLRIWVRTSAEASRLVLQFHHACCDALGAMKFIEDLLVVYAALVEGNDPLKKVRPLDPQLLLLRGDYGLTEANYRPNLRDAYKTASFWVHKLLQRPAIVATPSEVASTQSLDHGDLGYLTAMLSRDDDLRLRRQAIRRKATVNDLLLRDLLLTLRDWNTLHGQSRQRLVVNVPVSLRTRRDQQMPAANVLGYWFLERKLGECDHAERLLEGIRVEMEAVRMWRLPLYFIGGLNYASRFPSMIRRALSSNRPFATIVHSNAGRLLARAPLPRKNRELICGDVVLESIKGVPPVRAGTRVAIAVGTYGYNTSINLHWDPRELNEGQAQLLLDAYMRTLRQSMGSES